MEQEAPSFFLVPPTPLTASEIPNSSSLLAQPAPEKIAPSNPHRPLSQTTIFSIYSMYEDDGGPNWSASHERKSSEAINIPTVKIRLSAGDGAAKSSLLTRTGSQGSTQLAYRLSDVLPPTPLTDDEQPRSQARRSSPNSPPSADASLRASKSDHMLSRESYSTSATSLSLSPSRITSRSSSQHSPSSSRNSDTYDPDIRALPPLPPSRPDSLYPTPAATPPRQHSPSRHHSPHPHLQPPSASDSPPLKHPVTVPSASSKVSLVPSEGEDMDAFHVRNTYAQLEASGVKGDGYEEGVERTRAKVGTNKAAQQAVENAVADGTEKSGELDPREVQTLASVDRYGFFSLPSHDRLVLLNAAPFSKPLGHIRGPSIRTAQSLGSLPNTLISSKEVFRTAKWTRMLRAEQRDSGGNVRSWAIKPGKEDKLRSRVYKGIPDPWRGGAWELLMKRYCRDTGSLGREYRDGLDKPSQYDIQIDLDVPRTISGHIMFRTRYGAGQRSLFHVLHSFSLRCPTCGYVQGMGPIAATLLCYFEPERVYTALVRLHDGYDLHSVFSPGFPGLLESIYVQERVTEQMMPDAYAAFVKHGISTTSYATKWYITLFSNSVPFQTQLRLWDAFLLEGYDVFVAVAVAIVWVYRDLITGKTASFETILSLLSSFFVPENESSLLNWIGQMLGDKKLRSSMVQWRKDWKDLVAAGKDGKALL